MGLISFWSRRALALAATTSKAWRLRVSVAPAVCCPVVPSGQRTQTELAYVDGRIHLTCTDGPVIMGCTRMVMDTTHTEIGLAVIGFARE